MEKDEIKIIPLHRKYIDSILEIEEMLFSEPWSRTAFNFILKDERSLFIVALIGEKLVGYAGIYAIIDEANLDNIAVHPDYMGRGIAKAMLLKLVECAKKLGLKTLMLEVRESNALALYLYKSFGFYEVGRRPGYYHKPEEDAILMDLDLTEKDKKKTP